MESGTVEVLGLSMRKELVPHRHPDPAPEPPPTPLAESQVTPAGTDPLWYFAARQKVPPYGSARMPWIDGFVTALEILKRGEDLLAEALLDSVGPRESVEVAVRRPYPMTTDAESLAWFLFCRQADEFVDPGEEAMKAEMWKDPGIREFWLDEARAVLRFLP